LSLTCQLSVGFFAGAKHPSQGDLFVNPGAIWLII
jgi:hypothetical protein